MAFSSNRREKANTTRTWTTTEEITLCTAWCNTMETYGSGDITKKGFDRMFLITLRKTWEELFENTMPSSPNEKIRFIPKLNLDRAEEETRVTSLPLDEPLKTFSLQTLR
nr:hypothetical protein [Tanacetum cinerariifolium]